MKKGLAENKAFWIRIAILVLAIVVVIPELTDYFDASNDSQITANFFSSSSLALILIALFFIQNRDLIKEKAFECKIWLRVVFLLGSIASFALFFIVRYWHASSDLITLALLLRVLFYITGTMLLAFSLFGHAIFTKRWRSLTMGVILISLFYSISIFLHTIWSNLSRTVAYISYFVLSFLTNDVKLDATNLDPTLGVGDFMVIVGEACSGVDSLSMFIVLFLLLVIYDAQYLNWKRTAIIFVIGVIGTFLLNALRVTLIMLIGVKYPEFALGLFHAQAGWIMFSLFILGLLYLSYKWMKKK